ncbi:hypothetical protein DSO57_1025941 [Entomophthora muscae]|uniref:Uncharacterized protein n=1 Tax=Entomophthora muscae TaxID=34485 RepID=A0ACC2T2L9_9FUNG|nr:hypothetical protein DSO57_1025941 [Entomophthora muscae]
MEAKVNGSSSVEVAEMGSTVSIETNNSRISLGALLNQKKGVQAWHIAYALRILRDAETRLWFGLLTSKVIRDGVAFCAYYQPCTAERINDQGKLDGTSVELRGEASL